MLIAEPQWKLDDKHVNVYNTNTKTKQVMQVIEAYQKGVLGVIYCPTEGIYKVHPINNYELRILNYIDDIQFKETSFTRVNKHDFDYFAVDTNHTILGTDNYNYSLRTCNSSGHFRCRNIIDYLCKVIEDEWWRFRKVGVFVSTGTLISITLGRNIHDIDSYFKEKTMHYHYGGI